MFTVIHNLRIYPGRTTVSIIVFCLFLFLNPALLASECSEKLNVEKFDVLSDVVKVYDGDTIKLKDGKKVRLLGINTPELNHKTKNHQPYAYEAFQYLKKILIEKKVALVWDKEKRDRYHRYLAYVYLPNGEDIQVKMLNAGLATSIVVLPNDSRLNCYRRFEETARRKIKGIWKQSSYQTKYVTELKRRVNGYRFIQGEIKSIKHFKTASLIKLSNDFQVYIKHEIYPTIRDKLNSSKWKNRAVTVRGWVNTYKGKLQIRLSHPDNLKF
ncbi:MAG: thermonuclease family protein [Gammaproteobacteria bacterium]|nr:thermonuclease family protein [Gammaproteobacteria bacterium]